MTTATPAGRPPADFQNPAQLLAALPYLMGFRPARSVVLIGHEGPEGQEAGLIVRGDLPRREHRTHQAQALASRFATGPHTGVSLAIVGGRRRPGSPPPHAGFVDVLTEELNLLGLPVVNALWAAHIKEGARWGCYANPDCGGELPDPRTTVAAAAATERGTVAFDSRDELEALLSPRSPEALARRSATLSRLPCPPCPESNEAAAAIRTAFERHRRGDGPPTDEEAVAVAVALTLPEIRDVCLAMAIPSQTPAAREAEQVWLTLVREIPAPERAEPAALLGFTAYMRGDGAFAGMALDNALEAAPGHVLARLLKTVLDRGTPPQVIRGLAAAATDPVSALGLEPADFDAEEAV